MINKSEQQALGELEPLYTERRDPDKTMHVN